MEDGRHRDYSLFMIRCPGKLRSTPGIPFKLTSRLPLVQQKLTKQKAALIMEICKAPPLRRKALNKHTHIMYIEMENIIKKKEVN